MKRFLVLVNPSSHGGRSGRRWRSLADRFPEGEFVILAPGVAHAPCLTRGFRRPIRKVVVKVLY